MNDYMQDEALLAAVGPYSIAEVPQRKSKPIVSSRNPFLNVVTRLSLGEAIVVSADVNNVPRLRREWSRAVRALRPDCSARSRNADDYLTLWLVSRETER